MSFTDNAVGPVSSPSTSTIDVGVVRIVLNEQESVDGGLEVMLRTSRSQAVLNLVVSSFRSDIHKLSACLTEGPSTATASDDAHGRRLRSVRRK